MTLVQLVAKIAEIPAAWFKLIIGDYAIEEIVDWLNHASPVALAMAAFVCF